jgi:nitrate/nitrite transporter NarK
MLIAVPAKGRLQTLVLTSLSMCFIAVPTAGLPLLLPLMRQDIGLTYTQAGSLSLVYLLVYGVMQIPAGSLADRYSPRKLLAIGVLGLMGLSILLGLTRQYWQVLLIQLCLGFFAAFMFTPSMSIFIRWFSAERRTFASTLISLGVAPGILIINLVFPIIVNQFDTWRWPFIIFGAAGISVPLGLLIFGRDAGSGNAPTQSRLAAIRDIFHNRQIWFCLGLQFIRFGIVQGILFWLPTLLMSEKQFPIQEAGLIIAMQGLVSAGCSIGGGYLAGRFKKPLLVIGASMVMLGITTALMVPVDSMVLIIVVIVINAMFFQAYFGPLFNLSIEMLGPEKTGLSNGVSNMFAIFGALVTSYVMGVLRDTTGSFEWGFYAVSILCAIGLVLTVIFAIMRKRKPLFNQQPPAGSGIPYDASVER